MNESAVLAEIEHKYGSLEDFTLHMLTELPEVLEDEWNLEKKARETGLSTRALAFLLNRSAKFRALIRSDLVNQEFSLISERDHIRAVVDVARGRQIERMSPSGEAVLVDQNPADIIKSGEYLNKYRNTPIDGGAKQNFVGFQVMFGGGGPEVTIANGEKTIEIESQGGREALPASGYRPGRAGDPPPEGVRGRYASAGAGAGDKGPTGPGGELDFSSSEALEKTRDQEIAERTTGETARPRVMGEKSPVPVGDGRSGNEVLRASLRNHKVKKVAGG